VYLPWTNTAGIFFANTNLTGGQLAVGLSNAAVRVHGPLTLVINADQRVTYGQLVQIAVLAIRPASPTCSLPRSLRLVPRPRPGHERRRHREPHAWTARRWWTLVVLVFLVQIALVVALAPKSSTRAIVAGVPFLRLWRPPMNSSRSRPHLVRLPQNRDFAAAIRNQPPADPSRTHPLSRWPEPSGELPFTTGRMGNDFVRFMQTNQFADWSLDFKPARPPSAGAAPSPLPPRLPPCACA